MRRRSTSNATPARQQKIRCAIYTRKSTEEGLDQAFNSLDAQREACAAYVLSQRQEGWTLLPDLYDDGGYSGGNMERPGLKRLLADVRAGKVDVIIVYKVDRLTRSLTDFAKIVESLDGAGASFVSITQSFNTTTSMGRLTLNVLLSFAQFEREVISERVRDKVAASKAKGMWMGGTIPLGYDVEDRKLIINKAEAETVRHIMRRYVELGSVPALMADLKVSGIVTKQQTMRDESVRGGIPFVRGPLYHFLKNRLYIGEIVHHEKVYPGEHQAIVERALFDQVQALLAKNAADRRSGRGSAQPSLLAGMIRDADDRPMSPSHATKGSQRYRYYISNEAVPGEGSLAARPIRLPAIDTERAMADALGAMLHDAAPIGERWQSFSGRAADHAEHRSRELAAQVRAGSVAECRSLMQELDLQIVVEEQGITASCSLGRLLTIVGLAVEDAESSVRVPINVPTRIRRRGNELRLLFEAPGKPAKRDPGLIALIVKAHHARQQLLEMSTGNDAHRRELTRFARLSYLAPDVTACILDGRQPDGLGPRRLMRIGELPLCWMEQRRLLGFG